MDHVLILEDDDGDAPTASSIAGDTANNSRLSGSGAAASLSPQVDLLQTSYKCHVRRETTPYYCHSRTREMVHHHRVVARGTAQDSETVDTYAWTARCQGLSIFEPHPNDQIPHNRWFAPPISPPEERHSLENSLKTQMFARRKIIGTILESCLTRRPSQVFAGATFLTRIRAACANQERPCAYNSAKPLSMVAIASNRGVAAAVASTFSNPCGSTLGIGHRSAIVDTLRQQPGMNNYSRNRTTQLAKSPKHTAKLKHTFNIFVCCCRARVAEAATAVWCDPSSSSSSGRVTSSNSSLGAD